MGSRQVRHFVAVAVMGISFQALDARVAAYADGTPEQREACTPDAFRLCGRFIPDENAIKTCLHDAGPRLSPACYAVFYPPRQEAYSRSARRRYVAPPRRDYDED